MPPWVSIPTICSLSPNTLFVLGERARVRGKTGSLAKIMLRAEKCLENNETRDSPLGNQWPPLPTSPPESPKGGRFGGEEKNWLER